MVVPPPGKAVLSMGGLSHSVIRVDTEEKLSVLTVQDVGQVMPGGTHNTLPIVILLLRSSEMLKSSIIRSPRLNREWGCSDCV